MNNNYFNLARELTISEFKLRDQSSVFGFFWTLLHPLLLFVVLYLLFTKWMGRFVEHYPLYLIIGIVQWGFFASGTSYTLTTLVRRAELVKNLKFPYEVLVISSALTFLISHLLELLVLLLFFTAVGIIPSAYILFLPFIILTQTLLIIGISLPLSILCVYYRDIERIWSILTMAGFFLTPIFYSISIISQKRQALLLLNPMTHIINSTRACLIYNKMPEVHNLIIIILFSILSIYIGHKIFKKHEQRITEIL